MPCWASVFPSPAEREPGSRGSAVQAQRLADPLRAPFVAHLLSDRVPVVEACLVEVARELSGPVVEPGPSPFHVGQYLLEGRRAPVLAHGRTLQRHDRFVVCLRRMPWAYR